MNILFYTILFIVGIIIGNIWSGKAHEIPKNSDFKRTNYTHNRNEELISKLTYLIIGGMSSVILANALKINIHEFDISSVVIYIFSMLYISTLLLIGGIDKNYSKIEKNVLAFGIISSIVYMVYLFIIDLSSAYLNFMYFAIYIILLIIDAFLLRRYAKDSYIVNILLLLNIILVFTNFKILIYTVIMALIATILYTLLSEIQKKKNGNRKLKINEIPIGFFISASNVILLFAIKIFEAYLI